eukprot:COSAG06_NODE_1239_length_10127_cov_2.665237_14_plen_174_part_00
MYTLTVRACRMDTPAAVKMNATNTAGSDIAWGAYLGIAMIGADISDNSCTGGGCENEPRSCPHCNDGKPVYGDPDAGEPPPLGVCNAPLSLSISSWKRLLCPASVGIKHEENSNKHRLTQSWGAGTASCLWQRMCECLVILGGKGRQVSIMPISRCQGIRSHSRGRAQAGFDC